MRYPFHLTCPNFHVFFAFNCRGEMNKEGKRRKTKGSEYKFAVQVNVVTRTGV